MASSNRESWEKLLRKQIHSNYGQGWYVIGENSGRTNYPFDGRKAAKTLSIEWKETNRLEILKAIEIIKPLVQNQYSRIIEVVGS